VARFDFIADTSAIIRKLRNDSAVEMLLQGSQFGISFVTMAELTVGVLKSNSPSRAWREVSAVVGNAEVFGVSRVTPIIYADIYRHLERRGALIPVNDLWIAANCLEMELPLLARDAHFDRIPGLQVIRC
jgi:tRNA(fMet)-specific endonuclease VapC